MRFFKSLDIMGFQSHWTTVQTAHEAADFINKPHEDYPKRNYLTMTAIESLEIWNPQRIITNGTLKRIHLIVFSDTSHGGKFRKANVTVRLHHPPEFSLIPKLMKELSERTIIRNQKDLIDWYEDFEIIHPFEDGNGRVGGIVVSALSLQFNSGYLSPLQ